MTKKQRQYYKTYTKKCNKRCIDCGKLITYGNHLRCPKCQRFNMVNISYKYAVETLKNNKNFVIWFTGFWEGEGNVKKYIKLIKNKIYEGYKISVSQKEKDCLFKIKEVFRFGNVYRLGIKNVYSAWSTDNIGEIIALIEFMIPSMKSPRRINQLKLFMSGKRIKFLRKRL